MIELFINGVQMEFGDDTKIQLTKIKNDIGDVTTKSSYTNSLSLPKTPTNDLALGFSAEINTAPRIPYSYLSCKLIVDSLELVADGVAYLDSFDTSYKIMIVGDLKDFSKLLGTKTLNNLNLSDLDHTWNVANIITPPDTDLEYLFVETDSKVSAIFNSSNTVYPDMQPPSVKVSRLLRQVIEDAGYTADMTVFDANRIGGAYMFCSELSLKRLSIIIGEWGLTADKMFNVENDSIAPISIWKNFDTNQLIYSNEMGYVKTQLTPNGYLIYYQTAYTGSLKLQALGTILNPSGCTVSVLAVNQLGNTVATIETSSATTIDVNGSVDASFNKNDKISFVIKCVVPANTSGIITVKNGLTFGVSVGTGATLTTTFGQTIYLRDCLPPMKQTDFFKQILQAGFLVPDINNSTKTISFKQYDSIVSNQNSAQDWSDYLVSVKSIKFKLGDWAKVNNFTYTADKGTETYFGNGLVSIDNELLADKKDVVKVDFGATREVTGMTGKPFGYVPIFEGRIWKGGLKPRILLPLDITGNVELLQFGGGTLGYRVGAKAGVFDTDNTSIAFQAMIPLYFRNMQALLNSVKVIEAEIYLPLLDFHNFNQFYPVYIEQLGGNFFCNKINGWENDKTCTVELIKI